MLIIHKIATSRHASLAAKGSLAPRNDQIDNYAKLSNCMKTIDGRLVDQGKVAADRQSLEIWVKSLPGPWIGAMEATMSP